MSFAARQTTVSLLFFSTSDICALVYTAVFLICVTTGCPLPSAIMMHSVGSGVSRTVSSMTLA